MQKPNNNVLVGVGVVTGLGLLLWYAYEQGQKKNSAVKLPFDVNSQGTTTNQPTSLGVIQSIAGRIYNGDTGINVPLFSEHDEQAYQMALQLSNTDFTELYNVFNAKYQPDLKITMTKLINDQFAFADSTYGVLRVTMLNRLNSLNLP